MPYLFKCSTTSGEKCVFGLVPRTELTSTLGFVPKPSWSVEAHVSAEVRGMTCQDFGDGSIQYYQARMVVIFKDEHAQAAYVLAEQAAVADDRFDKKNLQVHYFLNHNGVDGLNTECCKYADLVQLETTRAISARNLARWAHQSK